MDIFEQQEMNRSRPQVTSKLNKWYDWLVNHVPKPIKDGASRAFRTLTDKVMGLYNRVTSFTTPRAGKETRTASFKPLELEQAFNVAYRSYRIGGAPKIDVDKFFRRVRKELAELIKGGLRTRTSAKIQTTAWISFI